MCDLFLKGSRDTPVAKVSRQPTCARCCEVRTNDEDAILGSQVPATTGQLERI